MHPLIHREVRAIGGSGWKHRGLRTPGLVPKHLQSGHLLLPIRIPQQPRPNGRMMLHITRLAGGPGNQAG